MFNDWNQLCASCLLSVLLLANMVSAYRSTIKHPLLEIKMFPKDAFPEPSFDETAPTCTLEKEPCGFYSFTINNKKAFRWVKSWCKCAENQQCAFDRVDMKMRVFRYSCVSNNQTNDTASEFSERRHKHIHNRHRRYHKVHFE